MPSNVRQEANPPRKRAKLDQPVKEVQKYSNAHEVRARLRHQERDGLMEGIKHMVLRRDTY